MLRYSSIPSVEYVFTLTLFDCKLKPSQESVQDEVYNQMIKVYHLSAGTALHSTALQCLGFLYRAYPTYMTSQSSAEIMDRIFRSTSAEAKAMLLRNVCDFLVSQSARLRDEDRGEVTLRPLADLS